MSVQTLPTSEGFLESKRLAFVGKLGTFSRKEASQIVRGLGAELVDVSSDVVDYLILGADELPGEDVTILLNDRLRRRLREGLTHVVQEHDLWQRLGLVEETSGQLYTPAMLAGILKTPVRNIRRWYRMGLLSSTKVTHRLPYFDFVQVQNARQLAAWIARGARTIDIARQLSSFAPWIETRSLMDLDLVIDGRRLLLRQGGHLMGANGQLHLDFDTIDSGAVFDATLPIVVAAQPDHLMDSLDRDGAMAPPAEIDSWKRDDLLRMAEELEDAGKLDEAIEWYRVVLARYGLHAEICFQLAELLYRTGDVTAARERYYNAVELEEDFVEARVNLGCVLSELGATELAIAACEGAIAKDDRNPDVHYHLARCLDEIGDSSAPKHWLRFLQLSPQSPWADEAIERLGR
jgi:tetratricopeptide (TPR) repeat protein